MKCAGSLPKNGPAKAIQSNTLDGDFAVMRGTGARSAERGSGGPVNDCENWLVVDDSKRNLVDVGVLSKLRSCKEIQK